MRSSGDAINPYDFSRSDRPSSSVNEAVLDSLRHSGWLQDVRWYGEIDSTNQAARRFIAGEPGTAEAAAGGEEVELQLPALIVADRQTAGRGRSDHKWWSPEGCLMFTLVVPQAEIPPERSEWGQMALVTGVAIAEAVERLLSAACRVQLKWPNDIYLAGKKAGGILIESVNRQPALNSKLPASQVWMIGVGLNVAIDWAEADDALASRATCLSQASRQFLERGGASSAGQPPLDRNQVLIELLASLEGWLAGWRDGSSNWLAPFSDRCILSGRKVQVRTRPVDSVAVNSSETDPSAPNLSRGGSSVSRATMPSGIVAGTCQGVDSEGRLIIAAETGTVALNFGEVIAWD